jgi:NAD(P)-dependent dehydrogenase (short-subunit alcohol dehydrogenase family)
MASYLITGSSRGIGFGIVSLLASLPASQVGKVFATSRQNNSSKLQELIQQHPDRVQFVQLDVTDKDSVKRAVAEVERALDGKPLDILVNNAGFMPWASGGIVDA